jgi:hypothetical protein
MSAIKDLPQFVRDLLASPPRAGEGVNLYLFRLARVLHPYRAEGEIADILEAVTANCGRVVTDKEIRRAIENSRAAAWTPGQGTPARIEPPWPNLNVDDSLGMRIQPVGRYSSASAVWMPYEQTKTW